MSAKVVTDPKLLSVVNQALNALRRACVRIASRCAPHRAPLGDLRAAAGVLLGLVLAIAFWIIVFLAVRGPF